MPVKHTDRGNVFIVQSMGGNMTSKKKPASLELDSPKAVQQQNGSIVQGSTIDEVARRAYEIYLERGSRPGLDLDDWLRAKRELKKT
jgi:hypothetical protein